jgi:hypothetical protein
MSYKLHLMSYRTGSCAPAILLFKHIGFWGFPEPNRDFQCSTEGGYTSLIHKSSTEGSQYGVVQRGWGYTSVNHNSS